MNPKDHERLLIAALMRGEANSLGRIEARLRFGGLIDSALREGWIKQSQSSIRPTTKGLREVLGYSSGVAKREMRQAFPSVCGKPSRHNAGRK